MPVRYSQVGIDELSLAALKSPFCIGEASNVFLETVKRGDNDKLGTQHSETTVVLRLFEAYGGHGQAKLKVAKHVPICKAFLTNLLEDEIDELDVVCAHGTGDTVLKLDFRGFEVKTIKLVIGTKGPPSSVLKQ